MKDIVISGRSIGPSHAPFIVAELSGNHNQSPERALALVDAAAAAGAHAVKIQTYTPDTITLDVEDGDFFIDDPNSLWHGKSLYELYGEAYTPWEWHKPIFDRCKEHGLIAFSTPFDDTAVDFLEELGVPCFKIASFEITHIPLLRKVASTKRPVIMSTGMATLGEIDEAVQALRSGGCPEVLLLKCTSSYPASPSDSNLLTIPILRDAFRCQVGLSDHTLGIGASVASVALGAVFVEKHFTLSRAEGGVDSAFSMEPDEMKLLVEESEKAWKALGQVSIGPVRQEQGSMIYRRSIYVTKDLKAGDVLDDSNIRVVRPGFGLPAKYYDVVKGTRVVSDLRRGTALHWAHIIKGKAQLTPIMRMNTGF